MALLRYRPEVSGPLICPYAVLMRTQKISYKRHRFTPEIIAMLSGSTSGLTWARGKFRSWCWNLAWTFRIRRPALNRQVQPWSPPIRHREHDELSLDDFSSQPPHSLVSKW